MTESTAKTAKVSLPGDREVSVVREFRAPRALVYRAYTEPELMQQWLVGMPGWSMPVCEMDVRPGGRFLWRWRSDDNGSEFGFHGAFVDVDPPAMLRHTQHFDPGDMAETMGDEPALVTVSFEEGKGGTTVTTVIRYASKEDRDAAFETGMTDGMEVNYKLLDSLVETRAGG